MSKIRIPVVFVFILSLSLFTLFVSTGFAKDNKIKQTHIKKNNKAERFPKNRNNIIRWSQEELEIDAEGGESFSTDVQFESKRSLSKASIWVAPELQTFISVTPSYFKKIEKGRTYLVNINVSIPYTTEIGLHKGTIHLRRKHKGSDDDSSSDDSSDDKYKKHKHGSHTIPDTLKIKLSIVDVGVVLPPDPGEEGKLTLLGIDTDEDGVRDDIQRYIYFTYPDDKKLQLGLTYYAKEFQGVLADADDRDAAYEHAIKMSRHNECLFYLKDEESFNISDALLAEILNTRGRSIAYITYSDNLGGKTFKGAPMKEWKDSCSFDVDATGGDQ